MKKWFVVSIVATILLGGVLLVWQHPSANLGHKLKVVAAENVWGNIAAQMGGEDAEVTSIITDPTADPHLYESSVKDAAAVANADIVIMNGLGYDDFMTKLLDASPNTHRTVITMASVLHANTGDNPHFWYDIRRLDQTTAAIQAALGAHMPDAAIRFQARTAQLSSALKPVFDKAAAIKSQYGGAPVAYTERVPGYLLPALGLDNKTPGSFATAIEDGNEPSPADQSAMQTLIITKRVHMLLYNAQASSPVTENARRLAEQSSVPVVAVTESLPAGQTYQSWMEAQLDAIRAALDNSK